MIRSDCIRAIADYLGANYNGPVAIHTQEDDAEISPPYAVVRIGASENLGHDQVDIWEFNVLVGVFHDADATAIETAEAQAGAVFDALADPAALLAGIASDVVGSAWQPVAREASQNETNWQHVAAWTLIAAPREPED